MTDTEIAVEGAWVALTEAILRPAPGAPDSLYMEKVQQRRDDFVRAIRADYDAELRPHLKTVEDIMPRVEDQQRDITALLEFATGRMVHHRQRTVILEQLLRDGLRAFADEIRYQNRHGNPASSRLSAWIGKARPLLHGG